MGSLLGIIALLDTILISAFTANNSALTSADNGVSMIWISSAIGIAMVGHVLTAALLGAITPIVVKKMRGDPAMISTPAVTAIADLTGVIIYIAALTAILFSS